MVQNLTPLIAGSGFEYYALKRYFALHPELIFVISTGHSK